MPIPKRSTPNERDHALLDGLLDYGVLTFSQVQEVYFPASMKTAQDDSTARRYGVTSTVLHLLYGLEKAGYVAFSTHEQSAGLPANTRIIWLARKGAQYIADSQGVDVSALHWQRPGTRLSQIPHDLMANTLRIRLEQAIALQKECSLKEWLSGRLLAGDPDTVAYELPLGNKTISKQRRIIPDSFCILTLEDSEDRPAKFAIEIDNSTHPQSRIIRDKLHAGLAYISSPQYRKRFGDNRGRWLFVMESERRMKNTQEHTERELEKGAAAFYFTTFDRIEHNNVLTDPIWFLGGKGTTPQALLTAMKNRL